MLRLLRFALPMLVAFLPAGGWAFAPVTGAPAKGPVLRVEPETIELGEIEVGQLRDDMGKVEFTVHNDGTAPLILNKVEGCCGTEVKSYPKGPILPGKSGKIMVEFHIEPKLQTIHRTVTILTNDPNHREEKHHIKGSVIRDKEAGRLF